jgi:hypothetical protein
MFVLSCVGRGLAKLITHPRSPIVCVKKITKPKIGGQDPVRAAELLGKKKKKPAV